MFVNETSNLLKVGLKINVNFILQSTDWLDCQHLAEAVRLAEEVVAEADKKTGGAKCIYYRARISYLYDDQVCSTCSQYITFYYGFTLGFFSIFSMIGMHY